MSSKAVIKYNGTTIAEITDSGTKTLITDKKLLNGNIEVILTPSRLPSGFQEVEWIQGTGAPYIDLGFVPTTSTTFDINLMYLTSPNELGICGSSWNGSGFFLMYYGKTGGLRWHGDYTYNAVTTSTNIKYHAVCKYTSFAVDGFSITTEGPYTFSATSNFALFRCMDSSANVGTVRIYDITFGGDKNLSLIPCYCTTTVTAYKGTTQTTATSGTIGMYDINNNKFYINSGSGTFTKGADVN